MKTADVNRSVSAHKGRYYDLMSYYGFHNIFEEEDYKFFQAFVNALWREEPLLQNFKYTYVFEYVNMQMPFRIYKYDISCRADHKTVIAAERSVYKDLEFSSRNLGRLSWLRANNFDRNASVPKCDRIISINIANFIDWEYREEYIYYFKADPSKHPGSPEVWNITIEVPKFNKNLEELETELDKWLYLLRNMPYLERRPAQFDAPIFKELFEIARLPR